MTIATTHKDHYTDCKRGCKWGQAGPMCAEGSDLLKSETARLNVGQHQSKKAAAQPSRNRRAWCMDCGDFAARSCYRRHEVN